MKIILASQSKNRHDLLNLINLKHIVVPSHIDEKEIQAPTPQKRAVKIAATKADHIAKKETNALIIAADTFILYRNKSLEKPTFKMDALEMLQSISGTSHIMLTGWCVINSKSKNKFSGFTETRVYFRELDTQTLTDYVNDHDVVQWAAGYSPQDTPAMKFIEKIEGSLTGFLYGLPLEKILPIIEAEK